MADRYWVGNGGNWTDTAHWSTSSGGASGAAAPTSSDDVYFDANSFSSGSQTVTLNSTSNKCQSIDWTGVTNTPTFAFGSRYLSTYGGNITFVGDMAVTYTDNSSGIILILEDNSLNITSGGNDLPNITTNSFLAGSNSVTLVDDLTCYKLELTDTGGSIAFDTGNNDITCDWSIKFVSTNTVTLGTSTLTSRIIDLDSSGDGSGIASSSATLVINATSGYLRIAENSPVGTIDLQTSTTIYLNGSTVGDITFAAGKSYNMLTGQGNATSTALYVTGTITMVGTYNQIITFTNTNSPEQYILSKSSGTINAQYVDLTDSKVTGGATWTAYDSTDSGNNTGWIFRQWNKADTAYTDTTKNPTAYS